MSTLSYDQISPLLGNRQWIDIACPMCGPDRRSPVNRRRKVMRVYAGDGGFISYKCVRCGEHGYSFADKAQEHPPFNRMAARVRRAQQEAADRDARQKRITSALTIWNEAQNPRGTLVETYLANRRLTLPAEAVGEAIRFHPRCPFNGSYVPAMVALVRDVVTNEPKAVHRTAIDANGCKAWIDGNDRCLDRMSLGPVVGGAVKLAPDEDVTLCLGIGEGLETTLSMRRAIEFGESPVWALLSAGQLARFPVLGGIETLWIAVDHDDAGVRAAYSVASTWHRAGREVFLVKPHAADTDLNDIV